MEMNPVLQAKRAALSEQGRIDGMTCQNCARGVLDAIQSVPGVTSARVVLESGRATARWNGAAVRGQKAIPAALVKAGCEGTPVANEAGGVSGNSQSAEWKRNMLLGVAVTVPQAMLGFLSPVICAASMGLSDLIVVGNALRLRRWKRWG